MNATPRDTRAHAHDAPDEPDRRRDDARDGADADREGSDDRASRVGAAQMAAPSTRRWRRAGRLRFKR